MEEMIPINVVLGDRTYRIRINPADEGMVRKTLKTMNDKIVEFKTQFAGKDMQDYVAMVMIWFATQTEADTSLAAEKDILGSLFKLEEQLDRALAD